MLLLAMHASGFNNLIHCYCFEEKPAAAPSLVPSSPRVGRPVPRAAAGGERALSGARWFEFLTARGWDTLPP